MQVPNNSYIQTGQTLLDHKKSLTIYQLLGFFLILFDDSNTIDCNLETPWLSSHHADDSH